MPRSLAASDHCKYVGLVNHLDDADASTEISGYYQLYFFIKLVNFKALLSGNCEVGLILVETSVDDLLFVFLHPWKILLRGFII